MAHIDLENLMDALLPFAQQQLEKNDSFHPYAGQVEDGQVILVNIHSGDDHPSASKLILEFKQFFSLAIKSNKIQAAGVCMDAIISTSSHKKTNAIQCDLEHQSGEAIRIYLPYMRTNNEEIEYGKLTAQHKDFVWFKNDKQDMDNGTRS